MESLPPALERKRRSLELALGRPVQVRGVRTPDPGFRGRLSTESARVLVEYQVSQAGYFWHIPIIEQLFARAAGGESAVEIREDRGGRPDSRHRGPRPPER